MLPEETEVLLLASPLDELSHLELEALRTYALSRVRTPARAASLLLSALPPSLSLDFLLESCDAIFVQRGCVEIVAIKS